MEMAQEVATSRDMLDRDWTPNGVALDRLLGKGESNQADKICLLAKACQRQLSSYPSLVRVRAPAKAGQAGGSGTFEPRGPCKKPARTSLSM
eukprot:g15569.t1